MSAELNSYKFKIPKSEENLEVISIDEKDDQLSFVKNSTITSNELIKSMKVIEDPLVDAAQNNCKKSIEELYKRELPLVSYLNNPYKNYLPVEEIAGCFNIVFCNALKTYDKRKGVKFSWYLLFLVEKEVQTEIPKYSEIYIPYKIRTMAFKVSSYLYYSLHITSPLDEEIRYGMSKFQYKEMFFNNIKEAIPHIKYQHMVKDKQIISDDDVLESLDEDLSIVNETSYNREIDCSEINKQKLKTLLDEVINIYFKPKDRQEIYILINSYMYSDISREGHIKALSNLFGCSGSNVSNKFVNLFEMLREFFICKGVSLEDLI